MANQQELKSIYLQAPDNIMLEIKVKPDDTVYSLK